MVVTVIKRVAISQVRYWAAMSLSASILLLLEGGALASLNGFIFMILFLGACVDAVLTVRSFRRSQAVGTDGERESLARSVRDSNRDALFFAAFFLALLLIFILNVLGVLKIGSMDISLSPPGFSMWLAAFLLAEVACYEVVALVELRKLRRKLAELDERAEG